MSTTRSWYGGLILATSCGPEWEEERMQARLETADGTRVIAAKGTTRSEALHRLNERLHSLQAFIFIEAVVVATVDEAKR